jgi:hypothetical protein
MKRTPPDGYVTEVEASALTGLSLSTLRQGRSVRKGRLNVPPHGRFHDHWPRVFYSLEEMQQWMTQNGIDPPQELRRPSS